MKFATINTNKALTKLERHVGVAPTPKRWKRFMLLLNTNDANLEQVMGIEPTHQLWKSRRLPLHHTCNLKSGAGEGNRTLTSTLAMSWATTTPHLH